ncbi:MAG TPA: LuxR C-terminal-related transcriptional regulator [Candidatus Angelobacter sp.]|jgi:DNA-binding NarL/FixJ family response regulator|nr:LuxR C-terminal-related transcriptional regulator [Candidatus Angelobacter sp.]
MSCFDEPSAPITVYILENNHLAAQYLLDILSLDTHIDARTISEISYSATNAPCILLMDQVTFLRCVQKLKILYPFARVLLIGQRNFKKQMLQHVPHEIAGFVEYPEISGNLAPMIRKIWRACSGGATDAADVISLSSPAYSEFCQKLTKREIAVVELMKRRLSNKEIASILDISEATVKFHVTNIFSKTNISRRRELFSIFQEMGQAENDRWAS